MIKSLTVSTTKYFLKDVLLDFLAFPVWWYSRGLMLAAKRFLNQLKIGLLFTGLKIWLLNLFKPMYGDVTWEGRLISFFMRFIFLILRFILMFLWLVFSFAVFLLYLALPPFVLYMIYRQIV